MSSPQMTFTEMLEERKWNITPQRVANKLFEMFCNDDDYRDAYEFYDRIAMESNESEVEGTVRTGGDRDVSDVRQSELFIICSPIETPVHNDSAGA